MAKIGVTWLEPERDSGKTTFNAVRELMCDRSEDLPAGSVVLAKWKSSGRSYRARLPPKTPESEDCDELEIPTTSPLSDSEDDIPPITRRDVGIHSTNACSDSCKERMESLHNIVGELKDEVNVLKSELLAIKHGQVLYCSWVHI